MHKMAKRHISGFKFMTIEFEFVLFSFVIICDITAIVLYICEGVYHTYCMENQAPIHFVGSNVPNLPNGSNKISHLRIAMEFVYKF